MIRAESVLSTPPFVTSRELRRRIARTITHLIDALDELDGDPDLEPDAEQDRTDDEPSLGWTDHVDQSAPNRCDSSDREIDLVACISGGVA